MMSAITIDQADARLAEPFPVPHASNFVEDSFGVSVALSLGDARQVFRWVAPGRFLMGSAPGEAQRGGAEEMCIRDSLAKEILTPWWPVIGCPWSTTLARHTAG